MTIKLKIKYPIIPQYYQLKSLQYNTSTEYTFSFYGFSFYGIGSAWTRSYNDVNLPIPYMLEKVQKNKGLTFEKFFAECVSHEIIHSIVRKFGGLEATEKFDNICSEKQRKLIGKVDFTTWHGGIPWFD